jgi:hypothetical protein
MAREERVVRNVIAKWLEANNCETPLFLAFASLTCLPVQLPDTVKRLMIFNNRQLRTLGPHPLPPDLLELNCSQCGLVDLGPHPLPPGLRVLSCHGNYTLRRLPALPPSLFAFHFFNSPLGLLPPKIPEALREVSLSMGMYLFSAFRFDEGAIWRSQWCEAVLRRKQKSRLLCMYVLTKMWLRLVRRTYWAPEGPGGQALIATGFTKIVRHCP